jgi:anti-sigma regulatory factor (Ser/Thr protein kinase)
MGSRVHTGTGMNSTSARPSVTRAFPASTSSVRAARSFVASAISDADPDVVDTVVLITSELVTNAILHARSAVEVAITCTEVTIRVEVADESPTPPTLRRYSKDAPTGRGLRILDALATRWGVEFEGKGKSVWFEVAPGGSVTWPEGTELVPVTFVDLPIDIYRTASEQYEGIIREFRLVVEGDPEQRSSVPARLLELIEELDARFSGFSIEQNAEFEDARTAGASTVTLAYELPRSVGEACTHLNALLDEADEYCRRGEWLLSVVPTTQAVAFRRWFLAEFARQVDGAPPIPFASSPEYEALFDGK